MKLFIEIPALIIFGVTVRAAFAVRYFKKANNRASRQRFERIYSLCEQLAKGGTLEHSDIYKYAQNPLTREDSFRLLDRHHLAGLFPPEFYNIKSSAESNLANWLEFPTELGASPDNMEHVEEVGIDIAGDSARYHVYKFRMNQPHFAAAHDWMLGVVGPYFADSKPFDCPWATFSRLRDMTDSSPAKEARWVHEHISLHRDPRLGSQKNSPRFSRRSLSPHG